MKKLTLVCLFLTLLLTGSAAQANIQVTGSASAVLVPDQVTVNVTLTTTHPTSLVAAQASNDALLKAARDALVKAGLDPVTVVVAPAMTTYAVPAVDPSVLSSAPPGPIWTVSRGVSVILKGTTTLTSSEVAAAWKGAGYAGGMTVVAGLSSLDTQMDILRAGAAIDARRKADLYAKGAGQTITGLLNLTETKVVVDGSFKAVVELTAVYSNK